MRRDRRLRSRASGPLFGTSQALGTFQTVAYKPLPFRFEGIKRLPGLRGLRSGLSLANEVESRPGPAGGFRRRRVAELACGSGQAAVVHSPLGRLSVVSLKD